MTEGCNQWCRKPGCDGLGCPASWMLDLFLCLGLVTGTVAVAVGLAFLFETIR